MHGHRQVFGLAGPIRWPNGWYGGSSTGRRFPTASAISAQGDGFRSCLPLRGSPGFQPGSLWCSACCTGTTAPWLERRHTDDGHNIAALISTVKPDGPTGARSDSTGAHLSGEGLKRLCAEGDPASLHYRSLPILRQDNLTQRQPYTLLTSAVIRYVSYHAQQHGRQPQSTNAFSSTSAVSLYSRLTQRQP